MDSIRVFVVSDSLIFSSGLESLLVSTPLIEIIGEETDINQAITQIEILHPDVIIWSSTGLKSEAQYEEVCLLKATSGIKFISLSLQNNEIVIYQSVRKIAQDTHDLIEAVEYDLFSLGQIGKYEFRVEEELSREHLRLLRKP